MAKLRLGTAALIVATLAACTGAPIDLPTLSPVASTPAATTPGATTPGATTPGATTPAATTPAASSPPPASPTPTLSAAEVWAALYTWSCTRVRHVPLEDFVSYLEWGIGLHEFLGEDPRDLVDYIEITVIGANDDEPEVLEYDAELGFWLGFFGLRNAGAKTIVNVQVHWQDGSVSDATEAFIEDLGSDTLDVRFPQEDEFGDCDDMPPVSPP
jgi:hypothetical protein